MAARLVRRVVAEGPAGPLATALGRLMHHEGRLPAARRALMGDMAALVQELCLTRASDAENPGSWAYDRAVVQTLAALGGREFVVRWFFPPSLYLVLHWD